MTREEIRDMSDADLAKYWVFVNGGWVKIASTLITVPSTADIRLAEAEIRRRWLYEQGVIDND